MVKIGSNQTTGTKGKAITNKNHCTALLSLYTFAHSKDKIWERGWVLMDTATGLKTLNLIITNPLLHFRCRNNYLFRPNYLAQQVKKKLLYISITSSPRFSPLCSLCMLPPPLSLSVYIIEWICSFLQSISYIYMLSWCFVIVQLKEEAAMIILCQMGLVMQSPRTNFFKWF